MIVFFNVLKIFINFKKTETVTFLTYIKNSVKSKIYVYFHENQVKFQAKITEKIVGTKYLYTLTYLICAGKGKLSQIIFAQFGVIFLSKLSLK